MKISFAFCLVFWITVTTQIGASQIISKRENKEIINENSITDIEVTEPELLDVYVTNNELAFEVCSMNCTADVVVCFEGGPESQGVFDGCDTKCGFFVFPHNFYKALIFYNVPSADHNKYPAYPKLETCDSLIMLDNRSFVRGEENTFRSCAPKVFENGLIKLNVTSASPDCPVIIKNAKLTLDVPTTVLPSNNDPNSPSQNPPSENSPTSKSPATNIIFGVFGWIFILISISLFHQ